MVSPNLAYVSLCVYHDNISAEEMTQRIGIIPDQSTSKGDKLALGRIAKDNYWGITTEETESINDCLQSIIDVLNSKKSQFQGLVADGAEIVVFPYVSYDFINGDLHIESAIIKDLSEFSASLRLDIWFNPPKDSLH